MDERAPRRPPSLDGPQPGVAPKNEHGHVHRVRRGTHRGCDIIDHLDGVDHCGDCGLRERMGDRVPLPSEERDDLNNNRTDPCMVFRVCRACKKVLGARKVFPSLLFLRAGSGRGSRANSPNQNRLSRTPVAPHLE